LKRFCTTSDINFLHRGLALYESLKKHNNDFELFYLCSDDESYNKLTGLSLDGVVPIHLDELLAKDESLKKARDNEPSYEAINVGDKTNCDPKKVQFFWCLSSYFTWYVLDLEDSDSVLYVDPDLYFYHDWQLIYDEVGSKSIGLVRHRIPYAPAVGEFNVGIVYFKKDISGYSCATFWKDCLLDVKNKYYDTHGMCGDQKYLELFAPLSGEDNVCIIDKQVGHLAPWNLAYHRYADEKIVWNHQVQDVVYYHFSDFKANFDEDYYEIGPRHGFTKELTSQMPKLIQNLCEEYYQSLKKTKELIK
tara:strand:- start:307 stop:1221 length:915 start_codon:yes stop_codon:yes gene_type:complete